ncbi:hypothetical protein NMY22_g2461 [Coprinellus aureogranulatus]|nr:hypothetical protein NMY22_g2461 [Coprinellus aureogranulatus]
MIESRATPTPLTNPFPCDSAFTWAEAPTAFGRRGLGSAASAMFESSQLPASVIYLTSSIVGGTELSAFTSQLEGGNAFISVTHHS